MLTALDKKDWNPTLAAHLLNRAGFGADPALIAAAAARPPADVVDELLDFDSAPAPEPPTWLADPDIAARPNRPALRSLPEEERQKLQREMRQKEGGRMAELRAWWLYRMRYSKHPLQEKLTLFWHGHFATSMEKVRSSYCLYQQNQTFRRLAAESWPELVLAVAQDPAMLIYLDNAQSRSGHPNENFARELMELFTLGEGHYREEDILEAARAFTGWTLAGPTFAFEERPRMHDAGNKTLFGQSGRLDGNDAIRIVLEQPAADPWITRKLWTFFAYANPDPALVETLAGRLREHHHAFKPWLREIFLSREFYHQQALHTQIKSPVQWLVSTAHYLEAPLPSGDDCTRMLRQLGQELFAPPNVKGWDGGTSWINANPLLQRGNLAGQLVKGPAAVAKPARALPPNERTGREATQRALEWRLFQRPLRESDRAALASLLAAKPEPARWTDLDVSDILHALMSIPSYQLT